MINLSEQLLLILEDFGTQNYGLQNPLVLCPQCSSDDVIDTVTKFKKCNGCGWEWLNHKDNVSRES